MYSLSHLFFSSTSELGSVISARVSKYLKIFASYLSLLAEQQCNIKPSRVLCKGSNDTFQAGVKLAPFISAINLYKSILYIELLILVPSYGLTSAST